MAYCLRSDSDRRCHRAPAPILLTVQPSQVRRRHRERAMVEEAGSRTQWTRLCHASLVPLWKATTSVIRTEYPGPPTRPGRNTLGATSPVWRTVFLLLGLAYLVGAVVLFAFAESIATLPAAVRADNPWPW